MSLEIQTKLASPDLVEFLNEPEERDRSVIVELASEPVIKQTAKRPKPKRSGSPIRSGGQLSGFSWLDAVESVNFSDQMDSLEQSIKSIVGSKAPTVRLNSAQAFVLDVSPEQLRKIASLPTTGLVRPNKTHRV